jgi:hypothetical protein
VPGFLENKVSCACMWSSLIMYVATLGRQLAFLYYCGTNIGLRGVYRDMSKAKTNKSMFKNDKKKDPT